MLDVYTMTFRFADDNRVGGSRGFCFKYCRRNELLKSNPLNVLPVPIKTGTTSVGVIFNEGVILGSETNKTELDMREMMADRTNKTDVDSRHYHADNLHYLSDNIFCCGAGLCADLYWTSKLISSNLKLLELETRRQSRVITAVKSFKHTLFQYQGGLDVNVILGGVDLNGPHLKTIYPHGSSDTLFYAGIGTGSMAAMCVLENKYRIGMNENEALKLLVESISSGIYNDLKSGSSVNAVIIKKNGFKQKRFNIESKTGEQQLVMKKDFVIQKTEIKRFELVIVDEKKLG